MLVRDRMTKYPLTIRSDESVSSARLYMQEQKVGHLPVVDKRGKVVGLIAEDDLLKAEPSTATTLSLWEIHYLLLNVKVKEVMVKNVVTTTEDTTIEEAAHLMLDNKIGSLPVVRKEALVGIITESDIFRTFMELLAAREKGLRIAMEIPNTEGVLALITRAVADQGGFITSCGTFHVDDTTMGGVFLKVRNVNRETLSASLLNIDRAKILDMRDM